MTPLSSHGSPVEPHHCKVPTKWISDSSCLLEALHHVMGESSYHVFVSNNAYNITSTEQLVDLKKVVRQYGILRKQKSRKVRSLRPRRTGSSARIPPVGA